MQSIEPIFNDFWREKMSFRGNYHNFCTALEHVKTSGRLKPEKLWRVVHEPGSPLKWNESDRILVVHLAAERSPLVKQKVGEHFTTPFTIWCTLAPQLQFFWKTFKSSHPNYKGSALKRIQQYMGFPLDFITPYCIELWVKPSDLFRPCDNPAIDYSICDPHDHPDDKSSHASFLRNAELLYYPTGEGQPLFPWTRVGYTYDWYDLDNHVGASEFVIHSQSNVQVKSITNLEQYLTEAFVK